MPQKPSGIINLIKTFCEARLIALTTYRKQRFCNFQLELLTFRAQKNCRWWRFREKLMCAEFFAKEIT